MKLYVRHLGSALLLAVVLVSAARGASSSAADPPCRPDGSKTLAQTPTARVYQVARERSGHSTLYTYGCLKESGSQVLLASDAEPSAIFPPPAISLVGPYVGYAVDTDSDPNAPGGRVTYVEVDDMRPQEPGKEVAGLVVDAGASDVARVGALKASKHGAVIWIACPAPSDGPLASDPRGKCTRPGTYDRVFRAHLDSSGVAHVEQLDKGRTIDPHSLRRAHRSTVTWRHGKKRRTAKLP
ncbi:MAG TPA: hypothetical protein VGC98_16150 [Thermoleophilaceae bacterium]